MGEFAGYALDETFDEEQARADDLPNGEPVDPLFDWGVQDAESLLHETNDLLGMLEGSEGRFRQPARRQLSIQVQSSLTTTAKRHQLAWQMRLGMAEQICKGKPLTIKQRIWMETNWKGGTTVFEQQIQNKETLANLRKMVAAVNKLASK